MLALNKASFWVSWLNREVPDIKTNWGDASKDLHQLLHTLVECGLAGNDS